MDELERQEQLLREAMRELQESSTVTADTFSKLNKETSKLGKTIEDAEEAMDRFWRGPVGKTTKAFGDLTSGAVRSAQAARSNRESFESLNPVIEGAAAALSVIPVVGDALGKTLSTVGTFVTAELQKSVEAFQTLGSVGGVGADGVTGLRKSAEAAGLAFDQLAKVTTNNAKGLAFATGSTAEGARAIAQLTQAAEPFRGQLLALGVGITEQSEFFADYLQINRRLGRSQTRDYRTLASGAADYAKQLNLLSRLTGESADAMKAELESQQSNVMFRAAMRGLEPDIQAGAQNIAAVLGRAGPTFQQGVQDMFGGAMGTEAAQAVFRATGGQARDIIDAFKNRLITQEEALARFRDAAERQRETVGNEFFAVAGNLNHAFSQVGIEMFNLADNAALTREALGRTGAEALATAKAEDDATKGMINAQLSLQKFAQDADAFVNNQIFPRATDVISTLTDSLSKLTSGINQLADGLPAGARAAGGPVTGGESYLVGEKGPEIVVPKSSGTVIPSNQLVAMFDQVQKMGKGSQLIEGVGRTFLPGVGYATSLQSGGINATKITDFADADIASKTSYSLDAAIGAMSATASQYTAGPRDSYANEVFGRDMVSALTMGDFGGQKSTVLGEGDMFKTEALFKSMTETLAAELRTIAANTKTGADTSKQLLRASTG